MVLQLLQSSFGVAIVNSTIVRIATKKTKLGMYT